MNATQNEVICQVRVNLNRSPKEMLIATGRCWTAFQDKVPSMPRAESSEVEVVLFPLNEQTNSIGVMREFEKRNLVPADPYSLAAVNEADPELSRSTPNATLWQDVDKEWYSITFYSHNYGSERCVGVGPRVGHPWSKGTLLAGIRKKT